MTLLVGANNYNNLAGPEYIIGFIGYSIFEYNAKGLKIKDLIVPIDHSFTTYQTWEYNSDDLPVKSYVYFDEILQNTFTFEYEYLSNNVKKSSLYSSGILISYSIFESNKNDQIVKEWNYSASGELELYTIFEYNNHGFEFKNLHYLENDIPHGYVIYEYNISNLVKISYYSPNNELEYYDTYSYNTDGIQLSELNFFGNGQLIEYKTFVYNYNQSIVAAYFSPREGSSIAFALGQSVQHGTGTITLKTSDGKIVETFDAATSSLLSISGSTVTVNPTHALASNTSYYLTFAPGTIKDLAGNVYAGSDAYDFTPVPPPDQIIDGTTNDDTLTGGLGNDTFDGGAGVDLIVLSGLPSQYKLTGNILTGIEGTDTIANIEQFRFGNLYSSNLNPSDLIDPDGTGPADTAATDLLQGISDLYVAYFNRAPDVDGLMYWFREVMNGSWSLSTIAQSFTDQVEYKTTYPDGLSNREFINTIYQNLFDRVPEAAGWDYWENDLNNGVPRDVFIYTVIQGAYAPTGGANDRALLNNKHDVSLYYSEQLATHSSEGFDYNIDKVLNRVTADAQTVGKAEAVIEYVIDNPITLTGLITDTPAVWEVFWV
jgi:hypothetical protein